MHGTSQEVEAGGHKIHFAQPLRGGLGMLIALVLFMSMEGRLGMLLATLAAGIGFSLFIDELSKLITSDSDDCFQPTIAIIFVILAFNQKQVTAVLGLATAIITYVTTRLMIREEQARGHEAHTGAHRPAMAGAA